jgi:hypothetical protein
MPVTERKRALGEKNKWYKQRRGEKQKPKVKEMYIGMSQMSRYVMEGMSGSSG